MKLISYLGSKEKLFDFIYENITKSNNVKEDLIFFDGFSGSGIVSFLFSQKTNWKFITNDISNYSQTLIKSLFSSIDNDKILNILKDFDNLELICGEVFNELSGDGVPTTIHDKSILKNQEKNNSRMFFRGEVGKKIDTYKKNILSLKNQDKITDDEFEFLKALILNYSDRNSNTTSVYGAYLKHFKSKEKLLLNENIKRFVENKINNKDKLIYSYKEDILKTLDKISKVDIIYLDPPYNTRSYESNYHILNYINDYTKEGFSNRIQINSKTAQEKKNSIKNPFVSKKSTKSHIEDIIRICFNKTNELFISYNNEGTIKEEDFKDFANKYNWNLEIFTIDYKKFVSAKYNKGGFVKEQLFRFYK